MHWVLCLLTSVFVHGATRAVGLFIAKFNVAGLCNCTAAGGIWNACCSGGGFLHWGSGPASSSVCSVGPASRTACKSFPFCGSGLFMASQSITAPALLWSELPVRVAPAAASLTLGNSGDPTGEEEPHSPAMLSGTGERRSSLVLGMCLSFESRSLSWPLASSLSWVITWSNFSSWSMLCSLFLISSLEFTFSASSSRVVHSSFCFSSSMLCFCFRNTRAVKLLSSLSSFTLDLNLRPTVGEHERGFYQKSKQAPTSLCQASRVFHKFTFDEQSQKLLPNHAGGQPFPLTKH